MKKIIVLILAACIVLTASCGPKETPSIATKPPATRPSPTAPSSTQIVPESQSEQETQPVSESGEAPETKAQPTAGPEGRLMDDPGTDVDSEAFCVLDDRMQIVTGRNEFALMAPASITKVMTCLVVCENVALSDTVTVSQHAVDNVDIMSSGVYPSLKPGEVLTVEQLLYALMLPSTNAAANVLAEYVAGSEEAFAVLMNSKAAAFGLTHSHFKNAHGLDESGHYTCAFDMAVILQRAVRNADVRRIMGETSYTIPATEYTEAREVTSGNPLLTGSVPCEGVYAAKNGFTLDAGETLVAACERDGIGLYCCTMKAAGGNHYFDAANLLNASYAFLNGTEAKLLPYLHHIRYTDADEDSIKVHLEAANDVRSIRIVYWSETEGTPLARTVDQIEVAEVMDVELPIERFDCYVIQFFWKDAADQERVTVRSLIYSGHYLEPGIRGWYEYRVAVNEDGFTTNGVLETKNGCYYLELGRICHGFVGGRYYAGEDGKVVTGWIDADGKRYYAGADGRLVTGKRIIDGRLYTFGAEGALEE